MKVAVIGSRSIAACDIEVYLPKECTEIVSGGAMGVDRYAAHYARKHGLLLKEFLPEYQKYGRAAPIIRNRAIVDYADSVLAFWDGISRGTQSVINYCKKQNKLCTVVLTNKNK